MACDHCEILPSGVPATCTLFFSAPIEPANRRIVEALTRRGLRTEQDPAGVIKADLSREDLVELCHGELGAVERRVLEDTRALLVAGGESPSFSDLLHMEQLSTLVARIRGERILDLLRHGRLATQFQPIVHAKDRSQLFAYECLMRGSDERGGTIDSAEILGMAREANLLFFLDREARTTAIRNAAHFGLGVAEKIFVNFNPTAIYAPEHCLRTTIAAVEDSGIERKNVVFEIIESDRVRDTPHLARILAFYRERGFGVALDDLGAGYNSLTFLSSLRPDYMKLDLELIRNVDRDQYKAAIAANLLDLAHKLGIASIAEGVETRGELDWVCAHGADFVQGYLIGHPTERPMAPTPAST